MVGSSGGVDIMIVRRRLTSWRLGRVRRRLLMLPGMDGFGVGGGGRGGVEGLVGLGVVVAIGGVEVRVIFHHDGGGDDGGGEKYSGGRGRSEDTTF